MKIHSICLLFLSIMFFTIFEFIVCGHNAEEWRSRAIYQLLTDRWARSDEDPSVCDYRKYCGGNWKSIVNHLDYIKNMGFNAIWISPIVENTENDYHGYAFTNIYKVNPNFGTEEDLKNLVNECHKRDIWVMVDVVANHCGCVNEDFSRITPFNKPEHYHDKCDIYDWNNQDNVENCRLSNLPDLKQEDEWVTQTLCDWVHDIVQKYDFDGIRVDTVPEVPKWFWDRFAQAAGVYQLGEVFNGNSKYVASYQGHLDALFNYPLYFNIKAGFCGNMREIESYFFNSRPYFPRPDLLGVFVENHDNARFLSECGDKKKFKNAIAFSMTFEGIPVLYYGGDQYYSGGADPGNREPFWGNYNENSDMFIMLKKINKLRTESKYYLEDTVQRYADEWFYAFSRGNKILVAVTPGLGCQRTITYHPFNEGDALCNILEDNDCVIVQGGSIVLNMGQEPKVYVKQ